jgi:dual specificity phosphatase 12
MGWRGEPPPFYPSSSHTAKDRLELSEVLVGKLYVTNFKGAADEEAFSKRKVTHVAAVGEEFMEKEGAGGIKMWNKDITDDDHQGEAMAESLRDAATFIHNALSGGGVVVVHCAAGISRSATVVLGYLLLHGSYSLRSAFAHLFACRPCIWPNEGFMAALVALEVEVRGGPPTITNEEYEHWGDYDGLPEADSEAGVENQAATLSMPMGPPRLVRDETCLEAEERELAALEALEREAAAAAAGAAGEEEEAAEREPTSPPGKPRRMSLSRRERKAAAQEAAAEAHDSLRRQGSSSLSLRNEVSRARLVNVVRRVTSVLRLTRRSTSAPPASGGGSSTGSDSTQQQHAADAEPRKKNGRKPKREPKRKLERKAKNKKVAPAP